MCIPCCRAKAVASRVSGLVIVVDEGQHIDFGQFLRVNPGLRIVDNHAIHPSPEEPLGVANAGGGGLQEGGENVGLFICITSSEIDSHIERSFNTYWKGAAAVGGIT